MFGFSSKASSPQDSFVTACAKGKLREIQRLYSTRESLDIDEWSTCGDSALVWASFHGRTEVVKQLLEWGADVDKPNKLGNTAAHEAARSKQLRVLWILAEHGADFEVKGSTGQTPLKDAQQNSSRNVLSAWSELVVASEEARKAKEPSFLLPEADSRPSRIMASMVQTQNAWIDACGSGDLAHARLIFEEELIDPNGQHSDGGTALTAAAANGQVNSVRQLIEWGADVDCKDRFGESPAHNATFFKQFNVLQCLAEHGADLTAENNIGKTPFEIAQINNHLVAEQWSDLVTKSKHANLQKRQRSVHQFVLACGLGNTGEAERLKNLHKLRPAAFVDQNGDTAIGSAATRGLVDTVAALLQWGADVDIKDKDGNTAAHCAAAENDLSVMQLLAEHGADLAATNAAGASVLATAESGQSEEILGAWAELVATSAGAKSPQTPPAGEAAEAEGDAATAEVEAAAAAKPPAPADVAAAAPRALAAPLTVQQQIDELRAQLEARVAVEAELREANANLQNELTVTNCRLATIEAALKTRTKSIDKTRTQSDASAELAAAE